MNLKKKMLVMGLVVMTNSVLAKYDKLESYGDTLYNLISHYVQTNAAASSADVVTFLASNDVATVYADAQTSGYSKDQVLFQTYQASFAVTPKNEIIIEGLHDVMVADQQKKQMMQTTVMYSSLTNVGVVGVSLLGLARYLWVYFRIDRPVINHYRNNAHRYVTGTATNTNNATINSPLVSNQFTPVPEPFFQ